MWEPGCLYEFWFIVDEKQRGNWFSGEFVKMDGGEWLVAFAADNTTEAFTVKQLEKEWNEGSIRM